jgi:broad specificity phosphatase PhoE
MTSNQRTIYLVRHGATEANCRRPYLLQGQRRDLPLCDLGLRQAQAVRDVLAGCPIHWVFSSPLRRAFQTAELIGGAHHLPVQAIPELIECDVGRWEGLSWEQIREQDREYWEAFQAEPGITPYAGGESFFQVQCRAVPAIERLCHAQPHGNFALVTHNVVARVYLASLLGIPLARARSVRQDNGGISVIAAHGTAAKVVTLNSVFHLDGLLIE